MKLRKEQIEAIRGPSLQSRAQLRDLLNAGDYKSKLEPKTADLLISSEDQGLARARFDRDGRLTSVKGADGREHFFHYNGKQEPNAITDAAGNKHSIRYNNDSQVIEIVDPEGNRVEIKYENGLPVAFQPSGGETHRLAFTPGAELASVTDANGNSSSFEYNEIGRLESFSNRCGARTSYEYNQEQKLETLTTPDGGKWRFEFDKEPGLKIVTFPDGSLEETAYDETGICRFIARDGGEVYLSNTPDGLPQKVEYSDGVAVELAHDDQGRLLAADNGTHAVVMEYDEAGRRIAEQTDGNRIEFQHGDAGLLAALVNHRGETIQFEYGADQRIRSVCDERGNTFSIGRDAKGQVTGITFPNGTTSRRTYSPLGQLVSDDLRIPTDSIARSYKYDPNGSPVEIKDTKLGTKKQAYDAEDRITRVSTPDEQITCVYDAHGNLLKNGTHSFQFNLLDQITGGSGSACRYDDNGNLVEISESGKTTRFEYDAQNQLSRIQLPDGRVTEYEYDPLGRRVVKRIGDVVTTYIWWGDLLLAEDIDGPNPQTIDYLYLPGTYIPLAMSVDGQMYCFHTDHLDTPIRLTDVSGQVVWEADQRGFGFTVLRDEVRQPLRFPGQYYDDETGLHYNLGRYFHPKHGKYLTPDPMFFTDGTNLYLYAGNNPSRFIDPSGRIAPLLIIGAAMAIGAAIGGAHRVASNLTNDRDWSDGLGDAVVKGAAIPMVAAAAVVALPASAGVLVVGAVGLAAAAAASVGLAALEAPPGQTGEACVDALKGMVPFLNTATHDYENDPNVTNPDGQRIVDAVFDTIGVVTAIFGIRKTAKARQSHAKRKSATKKKQPKQKTEEQPKQKTEEQPKQKTAGPKPEVGSFEGVPPLRGKTKGAIRRDLRDAGFERKPSDGSSEVWTRPGPNGSTEVVRIDAKGHARKPNKGHLPKSTTSAPHAHKEIIKPDGGKQRLNDQGNPIREGSTKVKKDPKLTQKQRAAEAKKTKAAHKEAHIPIKG